jgi:hypothetical protein
VTPTMILSHHPARATARRLPPSVESFKAPPVAGFGSLPTSVTCPLQLSPNSPTSNHLVDGQTSLEVVAAALLSLHAVALREFKSLEKSVRQISRADARVRLLMSTPGVGPLVALTYPAAPRVGPAPLRK